MAKGSGWNVGNVHTLRQRIEQVEKTRSSSRTYRERIIKEIRIWWSEPPQKLPRETDATAEDDVAALVFRKASIGNAEWANRIRACRNEAPVFCDYLGHAVELAQEHQHAHTGLRLWAENEAKQGRCIPHEVLSVLLSTEGREPNRKKGAKPTDDRSRQQLAAIVAVLRDCTPFRTVSKAHANPGSAYEVTAEATGQTRNRVAYAWDNEKEYWGK